MGIIKAVESLQPQSALFFKELTLAYKSLQEIKKGDGKLTTEERGNIQAGGITISSVIKRHTNLNISIEFGDVGPMIECPKMNRNSILFNEFRRRYVGNSNFLKKIIESNKELRGMVNLRTGMVGGVFAEEETVMHLCTDALFSNQLIPYFTPEELAAVTLHEVGHLFTYFEYITRSVTTNQALAALQHNLYLSKTPEERDAVFIDFRKAIQLGEDKLQDLNKITDDKVIEAVVISSLVEESRSELGNNIYDSTSWEYLSDTYATRYQAGSHLIVAMDKIYKHAGHPSFRSTSVFLMYEVIKVIFTLSGYLTGIGLLLVLLEGANPDYDTPEARFRRVRNEIIFNLKDKNLSKEDAHRLTEDIHLIDKVLEHVNDRRQFFAVLWDWVSIVGQRDRNYTKLQQQLENIANNDFYAKSHEIKLAFASEFK